eukprot:GHVQ01018714.1.p1 GENE.GHVQ01018714.1~~GHVQ01018714.1.p1  ORF type:complete len:189 (-),score=18.05 GHVQ01018714.1:282-848(-)
MLCVCESVYVVCMRIVVYGLCCTQTLAVLFMLCEQYSLCCVYQLERMKTSAVTNNLYVAEYTRFHTHAKSSCNDLVKGEAQDQGTPHDSVWPRSYDIDQNRLTVFCWDMLKAYIPTAGGLRNRLADMLGITDIIHLSTTKAAPSAPNHPPKRQPEDEENEPHTAQILQNTQKVKHGNLYTHICIHIYV